jgi:hypothetical protein
MPKTLVKGLESARKYSDRNGTLRPPWGRDVINLAFLSLAIAAGVACPVVHVAKVKLRIMATDLVLGRDNYARRYIRYYREDKTLFS